MKEYEKKYYETSLQLYDKAMTFVLFVYAIVVIAVIIYQYQIDIDSLLR
jgi:hypothetical protein